MYHNYMITSDGKSFNMNTGKQLKPFQFRTGYWYFTFYIGGMIQKKSVHRMLALSFIPNPQNKPTVNHKDGNKSNNNLENLEWMTRSENELHARYVLKVNRKMPVNYSGEMNPRSKPVIKIDPFNNLKICTYVNISIAGLDVGISETCIRQSIRNNGICAGFKWELADKYWLAVKREL